MVSGVGVNVCYSFVTWINKCTVFACWNQRAQTLQNSDAFHTKWKCSWNLFDGMSKKIFLTVKCVWYIDEIWVQS